MWRTLKRDIRVIFERDPAAKNAIEVVLAYPGLHAIWMHRIAHKFYQWRWYVTARLISHLSRFLTGIEIHPGARIGPGFFIDHGLGVVIGETSIIGEDVTLYQGVTLGGTGKEKEKRHPTLEDGVIAGVGAKILGSITIGSDSKIGAGAVVVDSVPPDCTVVGVPGRIVIKDGQRVDPLPDLDHGRLPDPVADKLEEMEQRLRRLEQQQEDQEPRLAGDVTC